MTRAERVVEANAHVVQFYLRDEELVSGVANYLAEALSDGALGLAIATRPHREAFQLALIQQGVDVAGALARGDLVLLDAAATLSSLLVEGQIDAMAFDRVIGELVRSAGGGGRAIRAFGEMVALLWSAGDVVEAIELENRWNGLRSDHPFSLYCAYPSEAVSIREYSAALGEVCQQHGAVLATGANGPLVASASFDATVAEARAARYFLVDALSRRFDACFVDDAALVVAELAANAVIHGESPFTVDVCATRSVVRISVTDDGRVPPSIADRGPLSADGRGLTIVAMLSARWGHSFVGGRSPSGKTVWAELEP